jgi:hypothetical protein
MNRIGDDRVAFYLENRAQIDEWAALKTEAVDAVFSVFRQLEDRLRDVAGTLEGSPDLVPVLGGDWPDYALARPDWPSEGAAEHRLVGVTLEMSRRTLFNAPTIPAFYVGVRLERRSSVATDDLYSAVRAAAGGLTAYEAKPTPYWPIWQYIKAFPVEWWTDRDTFTDQLVDALTRAWADLAPVIDKALT